MAIVNTIDKLRAGLGSDGATLVWLSERAETDLKAIQAATTPIVSFVGPRAPIGMDPAAYMVYRPGDLPVQLLDTVDGRQLFVIYFGCNDATGGLAVMVPRYGFVVMMPWLTTAVMMPGLFA